MYQVVRIQGHEIYEIDIVSSLVDAINLCKNLVKDYGPMPLHICYIGDL